jgi:hypothetical protein
MVVSDSIRVLVRVVLFAKASDGARRQLGPVEPVDPRRKGNVNSMSTREQQAIGRGEGKTLIGIGIFYKRYVNVQHVQAGRI